METLALMRDGRSRNYVTTLGVKRCFTRQSDRDPPVQGGRFGFTGQCDGWGGRASVSQPLPPSRER